MTPLHIEEIKGPKVSGPGYPGHQMKKNDKRPDFQGASAYLHKDKKFI